jgi:hypothetical protein
LASWVLGILLTLSIPGRVDGQVVRHGDCVVDAEIFELPPCAIKSKAGNLYLSKRYLRLFFSSDKDSLEARMIPQEGWAYFNRRGLFVVRHVANFDNCADSFHSGLVRVVSAGKWGLVNSVGAVVVPLEYDGILDPDEGDSRWSACKGCRTVSDGEHSWFEGGNWCWLNQSGQVGGKMAGPRVLENSVSK